MRLVILESPYAAETDEGVRDNVRYAQRCLRDALLRGEAPIASHLLHTQILNDRIPRERELGIAAGLAWIEKAEAMVVYRDHGISCGMAAAIQRASGVGIPIEYRELENEHAAG